MFKIFCRVGLNAFQLGDWLMILVLNVSSLKKTGLGSIVDFTNHIFPLQLAFWCVCGQLLSCVQVFATLIDCNSPGSSIHGIFQVRILEWVAISFFRGSSWPRDRTCISCVSCIGRWILYHWPTSEAQLSGRHTNWAARWILWGSKGGNRMKTCMTVWHGKVDWQNKGYTPQSKSFIVDFLLEHWAR